MAPFKSNLTQSLPPNLPSRQRIALLTLLLIAALLLLWGCDERTEKTDTGGILLEVEFTGTVPVIVSVNGAAQAGEVVTVDTMTVSSIVANPDGNQSDLMDVELEAVEITYRRSDTGTVVPPPLVQRVLATVPSGGSRGFLDQPILSSDQFRNPPLSDLLFENGGFDKETGDTVVKLDVIVRVFGRTLGNRRVESVPRPHTIEFRQ